MIQLYEYQKKYIKGLRECMKQGKKRLVLCAPTGAGKTVMFSYMISEHLKKGGRVLLFTHRSELLNQAGGTFEHFGLKPEFITAGSNPDLSSSLHIAMIETFNRRKDDLTLFLNNKTLIVFDEAHLQVFTKIMPYIKKNQYVIGATATPYRPPKQIQMSDFYEDIVQEMDTQDVIDLGKLCMAKTYGVKIDMSGMKKTANDYDTSSYYEENKTFIGVVKNWENISKNEKTILFSSNIKSSKDVCQEFVKKGYNAKHIDGSISKHERAKILKWFKITDNAILCNCGILTAGFDQPDIKTVILYRATTSLPLFLQMCGRGSRIAENKKHFNILDFGNNVGRLGFWEDRREWKLEYKKKSDKEDVAPIKECPKCDAINYASATNCIECNFEFPKKEKTQEEVILEELNKVILKGKRISTLSLEDLIILQKSKKLKSHFVWRVVRSRGKSTLMIYAKIMNYSYGWYNNQLENMDDCDFYDKIID